MFDPIAYPAFVHNDADPVHLHERTGVRQNAGLPARRGAK